jgi:hypothetical protein
VACKGPVQQRGLFLLAKECARGTRFLFSLGNDNMEGWCIEAASVRSTIEQINEMHARVGSARTFLEYVLAAQKPRRRAVRVLIWPGGHSGYFGQGGQKVVSPPVHQGTRRH